MGREKERKIKLYYLYYLSVSWVQSVLFAIWKYCGIPLLLQATSTYGLVLIFFFTTSLHNIQFPTKYSFTIPKEAVLTTLVLGASGAGGTMVEAKLFCTCSQPLGAGRALPLPWIQFRWLEDTKQLCGRKLMSSYSQGSWEFWNYKKNENYRLGSF